MLSRILFCHVHTGWCGVWLWAPNAAVASFIRVQSGAAQGRPKPTNSEIRARRSYRSQLAKDLSSGKKKTMPASMRYMRAARPPWSRRN